MLKLGFVLDAHTSGIQQHMSKHIFSQTLSERGESHPSIRFKCHVSGQKTFCIKKSLFLYVSPEGNLFLRVELPRTW